MCIAQICQRNCYGGMFFPVMLLLGFQRILKQDLLPPVAVQVSMRIAQICQSNCYFGMCFPIVLLLDCPRTLKQDLRPSVSL